METGFEWAIGLNCGVTVCNRNAEIIFINNRAAATFAKHGDQLTGHNLREYHGERAWGIITRLLETGESNSYTISKNGQKKLIHQTPWFAPDGSVGGLVELSMVIPEEMPHYVRG